MPKLPIKKIIGERQERCLYCSGTKIIKKGKRRKKFETVQRASSQIVGLNVDCRFPTEAVKIALQPFRRSLSPDIAQMRQESPFRV